MCNSPIMFDLLGEEVGGQHDNEPINLPGGCTLKIYAGVRPNQWFYEATTGCGKNFTGVKSSRCEAFDKAIDELADFIN